MDKRIAIVGVAGFASVGIALLVRISEPLYGASSLVACAACIGYLLLRKRLTLRVNAPDGTAWYDIGWLAAWGTALLVYAFRPEPYERPLAFFVLVALSCGIIAAKVIRCRLSGRDTAVTLAQAIAVGLSLVWTVTLMYPSLVGLDPWTHRAIALDGISTGSWSVFPLWHRAWYSFIAAVMETTGLEYRLATMSVSFLQVAGGASLLFLLGRRVAGTRVGLLAALVVSFSSWHIFFGYWTIPNGLGLVLLLLAVYLAVKHADEGGKLQVFLLAVAIGLLLFTYPLALAWLAALLCIWAVLVMARGRRHSLPWSHIALPLAGTVATVSLLWKIGFLHQIYNLLFVYGLNPGRTGATQLPGLTPPVPSQGLIPPPQAGTFFLDTIAQPSWETALNASGMVLGFALAIAGCLWLLSKLYRSTPSLFVALAFGFFLAVGIVPALFGMSVIEHRWWYAAQAFGAIPAAVALMALHRTGKGVIVVAGVIVLSFLMMIGLPCNMDNQTFSRNQLVRYALTQGELDAAGWALDRYDGDIGVDNYYTFAANLLPEYGQRLVGINREILSRDYGALNCSVVLVRDAIAHEPFALGEGRVYKLLYDPNTALVESGYKLVYSTGGVNGYVRVGTFYDDWSIGLSLPTPRLSVTGTPHPIHNGKIYIIGGWDSARRIHDTTIYDTATNTYSAGADYPALGIAGSGQVLYNGKIYVFVGVSHDTGDYVNWLRIYDIAADSWSSGTNVPWAGEGPFTVVDPESGLIYVGGGCQMPYGISDDWYTYNPTTDIWTQKADMPTTRGNGVGVYYNGSIYITAGGGITGSTLLQTTWRYDIDSNTWITGLATLPYVALLPAYALHEATGKIYIFGGKTSASHTYTNMVQVYDINADAWLSEDPDHEHLPVPANYGYAAGAFSGDTFYMFGGWDGTVRYDTLYKVDVSTTTIVNQTVDE